MNSFWKKTLIHMAMVGLSLAVVGHLLGRAFLMAHQMYSGGAYNPENERVLWQTPLVMSTLGVVMSGGLDLLFGRRKSASVTVESQSTPVRHS